MEPSTDEYSGQLVSFAYGELPPKEAQRMESHLQSCADCARALSDIRGVRKAMAGLESLPPPAEGEASLLAYAQKAVQKRPPTRPYLRWAFGAVAAVVVAVLGYRVLQRPGQEPPLLYASSERAPAAPDIAPAPPEVSPALPESEAAPSPSADSSAGPAVASREPMSNAASSRRETRDEAPREAAAPKRSRAEPMAETLKGAGGDRAAQGMGARAVAPQAKAAAPSGAEERRGDALSLPVRVLLEAAEQAGTEGQREVQINFFRKAAERASPGAELREVLERWCKAEQPAADGEGCTRLEKERTG